MCRPCCRCCCCCCRSTTWAAPPPPPSPALVTRQVSPGQLLFLPSGAIVSWHAVAASPGTDGSPPPLVDDATGDHAIVLEHCYVDASNVNRVISWLATSSLVEHADLDLLQLLQSEHLDVSLPRLPSVGCGNGRVGECFFLFEL